ncbi:MAG: hypothetical protein ACD_39C01457G0005 [uncultured bacterium]|nr:MAG: hypothetical protein ACD_39C01457G0005 [uncultured bacterium]
MGPTDISQARRYFQEGFPEQQIKDYLTKWRDRFWLFDENYPFWQIPSFTPQRLRSWTALAAEHNADNAKVLFDHMAVNDSGAIDAAQCTQWLAAMQTFSVSAGKSELAHTGTAPTATAALVIPLGRTLFETLGYCLVHENKMVIENDLPVWEREPETVDHLRTGPQRESFGYADRYTWKTRSVKLFRLPGNLVEKLAFASGVGHEETGSEEPMVAYRIHEKHGKLPVPFKERGFWREFDAILPDSANSGLVPKVIENAIALAQNKSELLPTAIMVLGQANDKAKIEFWRMERFSFPSRIKEDHNIKQEIKTLLEKSEESQSSLWNACRIFSQATLCRGTRDIRETDIKSFINQMSVIPTYWSEMESNFHRILDKFKFGGDEEEIELFWLQAIKRAISSSWNLHRNAVSGGNAWAIRALVKADGIIHKKLSELGREINAIKSNLKMEVE